MNILFDIRTLGDKYLTGVGFYTLNVLENLLKEDRENRYFLFMNKSKVINFNVQKKLLDFERKYNAKILRLNYTFICFPCEITPSLFYLFNG